jgi:predicted dehydrogenase
MGKIRAREIEAHENCQIVGIYDEIASDLPPAQRVESPWTLLDDSSLDAIFVCTPNDRNAAFTIAALERGKHVFCEKPPAFSAAAVVQVREAERVSGRVLMYGFNHRHHASLIHAHQLVKSGRFGKVLWMRGRYGKSVDENFFQSWRADPTRAGGGILIDQGIHMLDLMLLFGGGFDEVQAMVSNLYWKIPGVEDNVFVNLRNRETGVVASLHSTMTQWRHLFSFEVFLEQGHIVLNGLKTSSNSYGEEVLTVERNRHRPPAVDWEEVEVTRYPVDVSWRREIEHFATCIRHGVSPEFGSSFDALRVMELVDRIYAREDIAKLSVAS